MKRWLEEREKLAMHNRFDAPLTIALVFVVGLVFVLGSIRQGVFRATDGILPWRIAVTFVALSLIALLAYCLYFLRKTRNKRRIISTGARGFGVVNTRYETRWKRGYTSAATVKFAYNGLAREETFLFVSNQWVQPGVVVELVVDIVDPGSVLIRLEHDEYVKAGFE
jgi:hypothetical protein